MKPRPVDIVLFQVDGLVEGYRQLYERHCGPIKPCQVRDLGEIRYVFRSIARYAPWARRVLLVVQDERHVPEWVDRAAVEIVVHGDFIPAELLPTFQISTLQGHIHRIPGLGEHFIQWCDDHFLGGPVELAFFFDDRGCPRNEVYDSPVWEALAWFRDDLYPRSLLNTRRVLRESLSGELGSGMGACFLFPHMPVAARRSWWAEMVERLSAHEWFAQTITRKSRGHDPSAFRDVIADLAFVTWVDMLKRKRLSLTRYLRCAGMQAGRLVATTSRRFGLTTLQVLYGTFKLRNDPHRTAASMSRLTDHPPRFFCVNDDAYDRYVDPSGRVFHDGFEVHPGSTRAFHDAMERLFPSPCRYERRVAHDGHHAR